MIALTLLPEKHTSWEKVDGGSNTEKGTIAARGKEKKRRRRRIRRCEDIYTHCVVGPCFLGLGECALELAWVVVLVCVLVGTVRC